MYTKNDYLYLKLAAAFVRGKAVTKSKDGSLQRDIDTLNTDELENIIDQGRAQGIRTHHFKRNTTLPRVQKVLGILKNIYPTSLLDIGSGRGVFLWPLMDAFPNINVTATDLLENRIADINAVAKGGITGLRALRQNAANMDFQDSSFEVVTALEVLEHIPEYKAAVKEICRVSGKYIILSVPSKADNNPEHIHLFDQDELKIVLLKQGIKNVKFEYVLNHMVLLAIK